MLVQNDILEKNKCQNVRKIAEMFAIFENSNVDTVAAWFDRPNIDRPNSRLSTLVNTKKNFVQTPMS